MVHGFDIITKEILEVSRLPSTAMLRLMNTAKNYD